MFLCMYVCKIINQLVCLTQGIGGNKMKWFTTIKELSKMKL
jgi:hypothetical protein